MEEHTPLQHKLGINASRRIQPRERSTTGQEKVSDNIIIPKLPFISPLGFTMTPALSAKRGMLGFMRNPFYISQNERRCM